MTSAIKVLIADDHPLYLDALRHIVLEAFAGSEVVEAGTQTQVLNLVRDDDSFDMILLDLGLPGATGFTCLEEVRKVATITPVVIVSGNANAETMRAAFERGATGYLPKSAPRSIIVSAFGLVMSGGIYVPPDAIAPIQEGKLASANSASDQRPEGGLTARQQLVLKLMGEGRSNKQIAKALSISEVTVKAHVSAILKRLGVDNRVQAALAVRNGLPSRSREP